MQVATIPQVICCADICESDARDADGGVYSSRHGTATALENPPILGAGHVCFLRQQLQVKLPISDTMLKTFLQEHRELWFSRVSHVQQADTYF